MTDRLDRSLFGYDPRSVRRLIARHREAYDGVAARLQEAEARATELERELEELRAESGDELIILPGAEEPPGVDMPPELEIALAAVEHIVSAIAENARWELHDDIASLHAERDELRAQIEALRAEREGAGPWADEIRTLVDEAAALTDDVPEAVRASLDRVRSGIAAIAERLSDGDAVEMGVRTP